jgi:alpha-tubulin suppressor-like RCC1 family protein
MGQLGNGNYLDSGLPQRIGTDTNWKAICGRNHVIALKTNGTISGRGANDYKQLGTGVVANSVNHPVQIGSGSD